MIEDIKTENWTFDLDHAPFRGGLSSLGQNLI